MKDVQRGDSLIEVMIALTLMAVTALGLIATQTALARGVAARTGRADRRFRRGRHSQRCGPCGDRVAMAGESGVDAACGRRGNIRSRRWRADGLQVRYSADAVSTWPSTAGAPTDCLGQAVSDAIVTNRFYAKPSSSTGEPELYCEGGGRQAQPIVEGIERMRVMYWLAGAPSASDASAIARERWRDVHAADVCIVVRGFIAHAKRKTDYVDCNGLPVTVEDGRVRQVFWRRVAIRNSVASPSGGAQ